MICVGTAAYKPPGTEFIWFTTTFMLIVGLVTVVLFALGIENLIIPMRCCSWPIIFFCFGNFIVFGFNSILFLRIFLTERQRANGAANIQTSGMPSYGSP
ncbi:hypothetical protein Tcan_05413 [Toxocara canis]|uniref:Uncharacterized protein n=2 Tax=Toxocara canis TaxID=6265 RepID=A0A0B2VPL8_TOXCA|nr:hypothetical protein Tcan_05413 [Toxocara canis]VDM36976.1 unnamed protein product [Toxocara canis]